MLKLFHQLAVSIMFWYWSSGSVLLKAMK